MGHKLASFSFALISCIKICFPQVAVRDISEIMGADCAN